MPNSIVEKVVEFNQKVIGVEQGLKVTELSGPDYSLLKNQLDEEITELEEAWEDEDLVGQVDALLDLAYFVFGGLYKMGLSAEQIEHCFGLIHDANMTKSAGKVAKRVVEGTVDAVKPADFVDPKQAIIEYLNV